METGNVRWACVCVRRNLNGKHLVESLWRERCSCEQDTTEHLKQKKADDMETWKIVFKITQGKMAKLSTSHILIGMKVHSFKNITNYFKISKWASLQYLGHFSVAGKEQRKHLLSILLPKPSWKLSWMKNFCSWLEKRLWLTNNKQCKMEWYNGGDSNEVANAFDFLPWMLEKQQWATLVVDGLI